MFEKFKDIISGFFLLALAVFFYIQSLSIENLTGTKIGPEFMPKLVSSILAILSIVIIVQAAKLLKAKNNVKPKNSTTEPLSARDPLYKRRFILSLLNLILYVALMDRIGFIIMTAFYLFFQFCILSDVKKNLLLYIVLAIVTPVAIYVLFVEGFRLLLPSGLLG